ncbi:MAG: hypothetical protein ABEH77_06330, partial [Halobacteriaceae archaeon]
LLAAGAGAALLGLAIAVAPGLAPFSAGQIAVWALAGLGGVLALVALQSRRLTTFQAATTPVTDQRVAFRRPGIELDRLIARGFSGTDVDAVRNREQFRERLRPVAVGVVMRRENVSRERAEELLDTGEWTDNRFAARYFAGPSVEIPLSTRLRYRARGESMRAVYARHAVDELASGVVG